MKSKELTILTLTKQRHPLVVFLGIIILVMASCVGLILLFMTWITTGFWGWPYNGVRERYVAQELTKTLEDLPQLEQLELLITYDENFSSHIHVPKKLQSELRRQGIPPCYYARTYLVYGTQIPKSEVIDLYVGQLSQLGWQLETLEGHGRLIRGNRESLNIGSALQWTYYYHEAGFDYDEMSKVYNELIRIRVDYIWPQRAGC